MIKKGTKNNLKKHKTMSYNKLVQLKGVDGQDIGLFGVRYGSGNEVNRNIQAQFDKAFTEAAESALFIEEDGNVMDIVEEKLEKVGIVRVYVEDVTTDVL